MKITVAQPRYYSGDTPDKVIADFLLKILDTPTEEGSLTVLPEYSNAGGLSDVESELKALPRAEMMLEKASESALKNKAYVAINVLIKRDGEIKNSTYLYGKDGKVKFIYDKQHLPPSEIKLGVTPGNGSGKCACTAEVDGIRFAFMTCYDVYFNEQIEHIAKFKPDVIVIPGYQRGERVDIINAQCKLLAFRCNSFIARSSFSMDTPLKGGSSMIVAPDGNILVNAVDTVGTVTKTVNVKDKYTRTAGFGGNVVRNDDFINEGLCPDAF
ncbi:MAG: carbon-nitrogen hydrolase family protein [Clostridia bacterium]|nr:carbon-nitrogen hydrolase family protein [Clostridia bacterium]